MEFTVCGGQVPPSAVPFQESQPFRMYLLYLDGSGSVRNPTERHFVLADVAVFERQIYHLISKTDQFIASLGLGAIHDVELHASVMANGRKDPWVDDFINMVNWGWQSTDPVELAANALWRINHIHPFINGNGRTARAVCYFILCVKSGGLLPGTEILPELLRRDETRAQYREALREADWENLEPLIALIRDLLVRQLGSGDPAPGFAP